MVERQQKGVGGASRLDAGLIPMKGGGEEGWRGSGRRGRKGWGVKVWRRAVDCRAVLRKSRKVERVFEPESPMGGGPASQLWAPLASLPCPGTARSSPWEAWPGCQHARGRGWRPVIPPALGGLRGSFSWPPHTILRIIWAGRPPILPETAARPKASWGLSFCTLVSVPLHCEQDLQSEHR